MDIDKIFRGHGSAVEMLMREAERQKATERALGLPGAAYEAAMKALEVSSLHDMTTMDRIHQQAIQAATGFFGSSALDSYALGGVTEKVRLAAIGAYAPHELNSIAGSLDIASGSLATLFAREPQASGLAEALARLSAPVPEGYGLSGALERMMMPFEFQAVPDSIARLFAADPFAPATNTFARETLGDWRDPIAFRPNIELPGTRLQLYEDQGMSAEVLWAPADESDLQEYVESALLEIEDDGNLTAYRLLMHLEHALRRLIQIVMAEAFGPKWWKQRVPPDVKERCEGKLQGAIAAGADPAHPIDYADFTDYEKIICRSDNFPGAFEPIFGRVEDLRESLQRLHPVRLICMHSRIITGADLVLVKFEAPRILSRVKPWLQ